MLVLADAAASVIASDWAITVNPTFFMSVPTVVPVVWKMFPAFMGPEKVVIPITFSYERYTPESS